MDLIEAADVDPRHRHPWEIARLWILRRLIATRVRIDPGSVVIDIGCGDAFVLGELARGFPAAQFFGVDAAFTPESASKRQQALPPNVRLYHDLEAVAEVRPAALVLLMDVIEHIADDRAFLVDLVRRPIVGPATQLFVTVPAYQSLFSTQDVFLKHFRRYTNRELRHRLEDAGLHVLDIGYLFASLLPLRMLEVVKERISPPPATSGTGLSEYSGGAVTTMLLSALLKADAFSAIVLRRAGIVIPGLSNYAICRMSV